MDLIATRNMTYGTRRLLPGDRFTASGPNGRVLIAIKKAERAPADNEASKPDSTAAKAKGRPRISGKERNKGR